MVLEEIIYQILKKNETLKEWLASYKGGPAIFYQQIPPDDEWDGRDYPHILYSLDMQMDGERKWAGSLLINIYAGESRIPPEIMEPVVKECLRDVFLQPADSAPYVCCWARSEGSYQWEQDKTPKTLVYGLAVEFDILEFPNMVTYDPDPILTLQQYQRKHLPGFLVGSPADNWYQAKDENPAFYFRLETMDRVEETFTVAWMEGIINIHIFAPTEEERITWISYLMRRLILAGELQMPDGSPMILQEVKVDYSADYLTAGQIQLLVRFGILKYQENGRLVKHVGIESRYGG